MRIKYFLSLFFIFFGIAPSFGQIIKDTVQYKKMLSNALYNYDELGDSLVNYAYSFFAFAKTHPYPDAELKGYKILGLYHELNGGYDSALIYYRILEQAAIKTSNSEALTSVQFDRMSVYLDLQHYEEAKQCLNIAMARIKKSGNLKLMGVAWSNMGIIYRRTKKVDSAYYAYTESMRIKEILNDSVGMANTRTNLASLLITDNKYREAIKLLNRNIDFYTKEKRFGELWYAYMSSSEAWRGLNNLTKATQYIDSAGVLSLRYDMQQRIPTQLKGMAAIAYQQSNFKHAYEMLDSASNLESTSINDATRKQVTELTEKFKVKQKEQQNRLLTTELKNKKLEKRNLLYAFAALASIALIALLAWINIRRKSRLLIQQHKEIETKNEQLTNLNEDKNQLISMVSHDLAQPLQQAKVWLSVLQKQLPGDSIENGHSASLSHIRYSIEKGQQLITNVLQVEKMAVNRENFVVQKIELAPLLKNIAGDFEPAASGKNIRILCDIKNNYTLRNNTQSLVQVIENLLSNALKFSGDDSTVTLSADKLQNGNIAILVKDEGPGMDEAEKEIIFNKYSVGIARPTAGEPSTGLGLNIVKRLMLEMGGSIEVESEQGKGTTFRLIFKA